MNLQQSHGNKNALFFWEHRLDKGIETYQKTSYWVVGELIIEDG
jgi:hypothetical protein